MGSFGQETSGSGMPGPEIIKKAGAGNGHENGEGSHVAPPCCTTRGRNGDQVEGG